MSSVSLRSSPGGARYRQNSAGNNSLEDHSKQFNQEILVSTQQGVVQPTSSSCRQIIHASSSCQGIAGVAAGALKSAPYMPNTVSGLTYTTPASRYDDVTMKANGYHAAGFTRRRTSIPYLHRSDTFSCPEDIPSAAPNYGQFSTVAEEHVLGMGRFVQGGLTSSISARSLHHPSAHARSSSLTSIKSVNASLRDRSVERPQSGLTGLPQRGEVMDRHSRDKIPPGSPIFINTVIPNRLLDREWSPNGRHYKPLKNGTQVDHFAGTNLVRSQSVDHHFVSQLTPFHCSPVKRRGLSGEAGSKDLQTQITTLHRTCWMLHQDLESTREKLRSTMNSVRTFWSPELKRERMLRKEEASKFCALNEQLAGILQGSSTDYSTVLQRLHELTTTAAREASSTCSGGAGDTASTSDNSSPCSTGSLPPASRSDGEEFYSGRQNSGEKNGRDLTDERRRQDVQVARDRQRILSLERLLIQKNSEMERIREEELSRAESWAKREAEFVKISLQLETLEKQRDDQQEHINLLRDAVRLKEKQAAMMQSDVDTLQRRLKDRDTELEKQGQLLKVTQNSAQSSEKSVRELRDCIKTKDRRLDSQDKKMSLLEGLVSAKASQKTQSAKSSTTASGKLNESVNSGKDTNPGRVSTKSKF